MALETELCVVGACDNKLQHDKLEIEENVILWKIFYRLLKSDFISKKMTKTFDSF